jgi:hypothetical protein
MTAFRTLKLMLLAGIVGLILPEPANPPPAAYWFGLIAPAEARVGRPLTPVSVAGVARRTARRCAAGVYYC